MEVTEGGLYNRYSAMDTEELIELHQSSDLTDMAMRVLDRVLSERNVTSEARKILVDQLETEQDDIVPLASISMRFIAQIIDGIVGLVLFTVLVLVFQSPSGTSLAIGMIAYLVYLLLQDALPNGQSIGKRIMGLKVVNKTSGQACGISASIIRNGLLLFLGIIDLITLNSRYRQRLGDKLANTIVITVNPRMAS